MNKRILIIFTLIGTLCICCVLLITVFFINGEVVSKQTIENSNILVEKFCNYANNNNLEGIYNEVASSTWRQVYKTKESFITDLRKYSSVYQGCSKAQDLKITQFINFGVLLGVNISRQYLIEGKLTYNNGSSHNLKLVVNTDSNGTTTFDSIYVY